MSHLLKNDSSVFLGGAELLNIEDRVNWDVKVLPLPDATQINVVGMLLDVERRRLLVGSYPTNKLIVYNVDTLEIDRVIDLTGKGMTDIRLDAVNNRYLMFSVFNGFYPIDRDTFQFGAMLSGGGSRTFEFDADRNQIITADYTGVLCIMGLPQFDLRHRFYSTLSQNIRRIKADVLNPGEFYVIRNSAPLVKLDAATLRMWPIAIPFPLYDIDFDPVPATNRIYASSGYTEGLNVYDANTWAMISDNAGIKDSFIAFDNDPARLRYFTAGGGSPLAITKKNK